MRYLILALVWVFVFCAVIAALTPFLFLASVLAASKSFTALKWMSLGIPNYLGGMTMRYLLCPLARTGCGEPITLQSTQTVFQALFTFGIAIGVLVRMLKTVEASLNRLAENILALLSDKTVKYPAELGRHVDSICADWTPHFAIPVRLTFGAALICFYATAIVAGLFLVLTLVSSSFNLRYDHPTSVAFAIAPAVAALVLFMDMVLCQRGIHTALAPEAALRASTLDLRDTFLVNRVDQEAEAILMKRMQRDAERQTSAEA